jgi:hypothetical protein
MGRLRIQRPSPSMIVAFVALCVALAGTASAIPGRNRVKKDDIARNAVRSRNIARDAIRSRHIKKRNVTRTKIARNAIDSDLIATDAITGADILESSLATVPNATNATRVNDRSLSKVFFRAPGGAALANVLTLGGLSLNASCGAGTQLAVSANTTVAGAVVHAGGTWNGGAGNYYVEDNDFNVGESFDPLDEATTGSSSLEGNLVDARADGAVVEVSYLAQETAGQCLFAGAATG